MKSTNLGKFKWDRNDKQQFGKIHMSIFWISYSSALKHILELLNMQSNATMLNYAFFYPISI